MARISKSHKTRKFCRRNINDIVTFGNKSQRSPQTRRWDTLYVYVSILSIIIKWQAFIEALYNEQWTAPNKKINVKIKTSNEKQQIFKKAEERWVLSNNLKTWIIGAESPIFIGSLLPSRGAAAWKALSPATASCSWNMKQRSVEWRAGGNVTVDGLLLISTSSLAFCDDLFVSVWGWGGGGVSKKRIP